MSVDCGSVIGTADERDVADVALIVESAAVAVDASTAVHHRSVLTQISSILMSAVDAT